MQGEYAIYVVDNDPSARKGITRLLHTAGYHVRAFSSVDKFIESFNPDKSGCMIIDAGIPGRVVGALLNKIKGNAVVNLPIIVIASEDDTNTMQKVAKLKASEFFCKPVDGTALLDAVNRAVSSRIKD